MTVGKAAKQILFWLWVIFFIHPGGAQEVITWATNPQYPPYDWSADGRTYEGAAADLLPLIQPEGYRFQAVLVPWKRAQEMARVGEIDLLVNLRITPERSQWLEFSKNPTFYNPIVIFTRTPKAFPLKSWELLIPLRGGTALGDTYGNGFDEFLKAKLTTEVASNMALNFQKLNAGRIDYFITGYYTGLSWLAAAGLSENITALEPPVSTNYIHLGFSRLSPRKHLLPEIDRRLEALGRSGDLDRMLQSQLKKFSGASLEYFSP